MYKKCFSFSASVETEYETKSWHPGLEFEAAKKEIDNKWEEKDDFWNTDKGAYSFTVIELVGISYWKQIYIIIISIVGTWSQ